MFACGKLNKNAHGFVATREPCGRDQNFVLRYYGFLLLVLNDSRTKLNADAGG